jgi:hypothetical protein
MAQAVTSPDGGWESGQDAGPAGGIRRALAVPGHHARIRPAFPVGVTWTVVRENHIVAEGGPLGEGEAMAAVATWETAQSRTLNPALLSGGNPDDPYRLVRVNGACLRVPWPELPDPDDCRLAVDCGAYEPHWPEWHGTAVCTLAPHPLCVSHIAHGGQWKVIAIWTDPAAAACDCAGPGTCEMFIPVTGTQPGR